MRIGMGRRGADNGMDLFSAMAPLLAVADDPEKPVPEVIRDGLVLRHEPPRQTFHRRP
jgi:hypothetical protein